MDQKQKKNYKGEEMRYVPLNSGYPYQALRLIQAQIACSAEQMKLIIRNYFQDDLDEF